MKVYTINLYEYFGFERPENSAGDLTCYIPDRAKEYGANRLRPAMLVIPGGAYAYCSTNEQYPCVKNLSATGSASLALQ